MDLHRLLLVSYMEIILLNTYYFTIRNIIEYYRINPSTVDFDTWLLLKELLVQRCANTPSLHWCLAQPNLSVYLHKMPSFHFFPLLPAELRIKIWHMTVEPREVPVTCWKGNARHKGPTLDVYLKMIPGVSTNRVLENKPFLPQELYAASHLKPSLLDVCQESRAVALKWYERIILTEDSNASYAWINYDIDLLSFEEEEDYECFIYCGPRVKRVKFPAQIDDEYWFHTKSNGMGYFTNLQECWIVLVGEGFLDWAELCNYGQLRCKNENVHILDSETGQSMTWPEIRALEDERERKMEEEEGRLWSETGDSSSPVYGVYRLLD